MEISEDNFFMKEALRLAGKGLSWTSPHPMVGSVIVKNSEIIARGFHSKFGTDHAEMQTLKNSKEDLRGTTMYVTLEPCHLPYDLHGPRLACTEIIKIAGIRTVHIAMLDSNPEVNGKGRMVLEKAGIKTTLGIMQKEALILNETYHHFMNMKRPFVGVTFSSSLDGKIATRTGQSKWISNEKSRKFARKLRCQYQAVLVGINTILKDNPHLGARIKGKKDPLRIILDSTLKIPVNSKVLRDKNVIIATTEKANKSKKISLTGRGIEILNYDNQSNPIANLLEELRKRKIISLLVEGGGKILGSFADEKLIDKVYSFHSPLLIGGEKGISVLRGRGVKKIADAIRLKNNSFKKFDDDILTIGYS